MPFPKGYKPPKITRKPRTQKLTRLQAIRAKCRDCIYDECSPGTWRQQVDACTSTDCALHEWRPRSSAPKALPPSTPDAEPQS